MSKLIYDKEEYVLTPELISSLSQFISSVTTEVGGVATPVYTSISEVIFANLKDGLFKSVIEKYPPQDIKNHKDTIEAEEIIIDQKKELFIKIK